MTDEQRAAGSGQQAAEHAKNRAAVLTPPGAAAIAVVRISGRQVTQFLQSHFTAQAVENRCVHGTLRDSERIIDDPVIVLSDNRQTADINLHGGEWVVRECLELARRSGFEIVDCIPDQFASALEQEMIEALPLARTQIAVRTLLAQPQAWSQLLQELAACAKPDLQARVNSILSDRSLWWMLHPPKIAIVGVANVGKSTLANQLFGQERSITADVPGTTRDWVGDWTNIDGLPVMLLDTPGIRHSADAIEQTAITRSSEQIAGADLVIVVLDPTQPRPAQREILEQFPSALVVINKSDLQDWTGAPVDAVRTVAVTGAGLELLRQKIRERFIASSTSENSPKWWTDRQRQFLAQAAGDPKEPPRFL
jgi:small GTP-binding protein